MPMTPKKAIIIPPKAQTETIKDEYPPGGRENINQLVIIKIAYKNENIKINNPTKKIPTSGELLKDVTELMSWDTFLRNV